MEYIVRTRLALPAAALAAGALALVPALPAAAATQTWTSPTDSNWSTATWSTTVPVAGDDITFAGGVRSTYNLGNVTFSSLRFTNEHQIANGGGALTLTNGIVVDAGAPARIDPGLTTSGPQTFAVGTGGSLTFPSLVNVDPASTLTLDVDGTLAVTTGDLNGGAGACIQSVGSGVVSFSAGGGGVGACPGQPVGLLVTAGETTFTPGASLGGKDFVAAGGLLTGGDLATPAVIRALSLVAGGTVSPGGSGGTGLGELQLWGTSAWTGGTYLPDVDGSGSADRVSGAGQAISVSGTTLSPRLGGTALAGQSWVVLASDVGVSGRFQSPAGAALDDGDEFAANGQIYSIAYSPLEVEVTWLRAAPVVVPPVTPVTPSAPTLPATGPADAGPAAGLALLAVFAGLGMVAVGRRRTA